MLDAGIGREGGGGEVDPSRKGRIIPNVFDGSTPAHSRLRARARVRVHSVEIIVNLRAPVVTSRPSDVLPPLRVLRKPNQ